MAQEEDDLLLALALAVPFLKCTESAPPEIFDSTVNQLVTLMEQNRQEEKESKKESFSFESFFDQLLEQVSLGVMGDGKAGDWENNARVLMRIMKEAFLPKFSAAARRYLLLVVAVFVEYLRFYVGFTAALRPIGILDDFSHATLSFIVQLFEEITCTFNSGSLEEREQCGVVNERLLRIVSHLTQADSTLHSQAYSFQESLPPIPAFPEHSIKDASDEKRNAAMLNPFAPIERSSSFGEGLSLWYKRNIALWVGAELNGFRRMIRALASSFGNHFSDLPALPTDLFTQHDNSFSRIFDIINSTDVKEAAFRALDRRHLVNDLVQLVENYCIASISVLKHLQAVQDNQGMEQPLLMRELLSLARNLEGDWLTRDLMALYVERFVAFVDQDASFTALGSLSSIEFFSRPVRCLINSTFFGDFLHFLGDLITGLNLKSQSGTQSTNPYAGEIETLNNLSFQQPVQFMLQTPLLSVLFRGIMVLYKDAVFSDICGEDDEDDDDQMEEARTSPYSYPEGVSKAHGHLNTTCSVLRDLLSSNLLVKSKESERSEIISQTFLQMLLRISHYQSDRCIVTITLEEEASPEITPLQRSDRWNGFGQTLRALWASIVQNWLSPTTETFVLKQMGIVDTSSWPSHLPSEQVPIAALIVFCRVPQSPEYKAMVIKSAWNGVLSSIRSILQMENPDVVSTFNEVLGAPYLQFLLYLFSLAGDDQKKRIVEECVDILLGDPVHQAPVYFLIMARMLQLVHYFLIFYTVPAHSVERFLGEVLFVPEKSFTVESELEGPDSLLPDCCHALPTLYDALTPLNIAKPTTFDAPPWKILLLLDDREQCKVRMGRLANLFDRSMTVNQELRSFGAWPSKIYQSFYQEFLKLFNILPCGELIWSDSEVELFDTLKGNRAVCYMMKMMQNTFQDGVSSNQIPQLTDLEDYVNVLAFLNHSSAELEQSIGSSVAHPLALTEGATILFINSIKRFAESENKEFRILPFLLVSVVNTFKTYVNAFEASKRASISDCSDQMPDEIRQLAEQCLPLEALQCSYANSAQLGMIFYRHSLWVADVQKSEDFEESSCNNFLSNLDKLLPSLEGLVLEESEYACALSYVLSSVMALISRILRTFGRTVESESDLKPTLLRLYQMAPHLSGNIFQLLKQRSDSSSTQMLLDLSKTHAIEKVLEFIMDTEALDGEEDRFHRLQGLLVNILNITNNALEKNKGDKEFMNKLPIVTLVRLVILNSSGPVDDLLVKLMTTVFLVEKKFSLPDDCQGKLKLSRELTDSWMKRIFFRAPTSCPTSLEKKKVLTRLIFLLGKNEQMGTLVYQSLESALPSGMELPPPRFLAFYVLLKQLAYYKQLPRFIANSATALLASTEQSCQNRLNQAVVLGSMQRTFQMLSERSAPSSQQCTATIYGKQFAPQHWYYCYTCNLVYNKGICSSCAEHCHKDHQISYARYSRFMCDCMTSSSRCSRTQPDSYTIRFEISARQNQSTPQEIREAVHQVIQTDQTEGKLVSYLQNLLHALIEIDEVEDQCNFAQLQLPVDCCMSKKATLLTLEASIDADISLKTKGDSDEVQQILALCTSGTIQRHLMDVSLKGFVAVGDNNTLSIGAIPHLFHSRRPGTQTTEELNFYVLHTSSVTPLTQVHFHPDNGCLLAIGGISEVKVITLDDRGAVRTPSRKLQVKPSLSNSGEACPIIQIFWIRQSTALLAVLTTKELFVFDVSVNLSQPIHHYSSVSSPLQSACVIPGNGERLTTLLVLTTDGQLFRQELPSEAQKEQLYLCNTFMLPGRFADSRPEGRAVFYFADTETLLISFRTETFLGKLSPSSTTIEKFTVLTSIGSKWAQIPTQPDTFVLLNGGHALTAIKVTSNDVLVQSLSSSTENFCVFPFLSENSPRQSAVCLSLLQDGSLRSFSVAQEGRNTGSEVCEVQKILDFYFCDEGIPSESSYETWEHLNDLPSLSFEAMQCVTREATFSGDLLHYYPEQIIQQRLSLQDEYLVSPIAPEFSIFVHYTAPTKLLSGIRVLVGHSSLKHIPRKLIVGDQERECKPNQRRWYEFPLQPADILECGSELELSVRAAAGSAVVIDSIEVYAVSQDSLLLPSNYLTPQSLPGVRNATQRAALLAAAALAKFYEVYPARAKEATVLKNSLLPLLNNSEYAPLHAAIRNLFVSLCSTFEESQAMLDHARLEFISVQCTGDLSLSAAVEFNNSLAAICHHRPAHIRKFLQSVPEFAKIILNSFWSVIKQGKDEDDLFYNNKLSLTQTAAQILFHYLFHVAAADENEMNDQSATSKLNSALSLFQPFLCSSDHTIRVAAAQEIGLLVQETRHPVVSRSSALPASSAEATLCSPDSPAPISADNQPSKPIFYRCDACDERIDTLRWHCEECEDYDLCDECQQNCKLQQVIGLGAVHSDTHHMTCILIEGQSSNAPTATQALEPMVDDEDDLMEDDESDEDDEEDMDSDLRLAIAMSLKEASASAQPPAAEPTPEPSYNGAMDQVISVLFSYLIEQVTYAVHENQDEGKQDVHHLLLTSLRLAYRLFLIGPASTTENLLSIFTALQLPQIRKMNQEAIVIVLGFLHSILQDMPKTEGEQSIMNVLAQATWIEELYRLLESNLGGIEEMKIDEPSDVKAVVDAPLSPLHPRKPPCAKYYFAPFLSSTQIDTHCSGTEMKRPTRLVTENIVHLVHLMYEKLPNKDDMSLFGSKDWKELLCQLLRKSQDEPLRKEGRSLLKSLCGSPEEFRHYWDHNQMQTIYDQIDVLVREHNQLREELSYEVLVSLMSSLKQLWKRASRRPQHWQTFLTKKSAFLELLFHATFYLPSDCILLLMKLLSCAFARSPVSEENQNEEGVQGTVPSAPIPENQEVPTKCLVKNLLTRQSEEHPMIQQFIERFLLAGYSKAVRDVTCEFLFNIWINGDSGDRLTLRPLLLHASTLLSQYGRNAGEFLNLISRLIRFKENDVVSEEVSDHFLPAILGTIREQSKALQSHPKSFIYRDLEQVGALEGFFLEEEPCLICNDTETPFRNFHLDSLQGEMRYTENAIIAKLSGRYTLQQISFHYSAVNKARTPRQLRFYYNNRPAETVIDLVADAKGNKTLWKKAQFVTLEHSRATVEFLVPITVSNLLIEFADFVEDKQAKEKIICFRCNHVVRDPHGICEVCRDNALQCRDCRNINYENLRAFLCNECGRCKYGRFHFTFHAKSSTASSKIENEADEEKALKLLSKESDTARSKMQRLSSFQVQIVHLLSSHPGGKSRDSSSNRSPPRRGWFGSHSHRREEDDGPVSAPISMINDLYHHCKSDYQSLCSSLQKLQSTRQELRLFHKQREVHEVPKRSSPCFGCTNGFVILCLRFLESLMGDESIRKRLVTLGAIPDLLVVRPLYLKATAKNDKFVQRLLLCKLVRNLPQATDVLNGLLTAQLEQAVDSRDTLTYRTFPDDAMDLLCQSACMMDSCWPTRLRVLLGLLIRSVMIPAHPVIDELVILPSLELLLMVIEPAVSNKPETVTARPTVMLSEWNASPQFYSIWRERHEPLLFTSANKKQNPLAIQRILHRWKAAAGLIKPSTTLLPTPLAVLKDENWLLQLISKSNSHPVRKVSSSLLLALARAHPARSLSVLNNVQRYLMQLDSDDDESLSEFFTLFDNLVAPEGHRAFLVLRGFLQELTHRIQQRVKTVRKEEDSSGFSPTKGFLLHRLILLLKSFLDDEGIRRHFRSLQLMTPLFDSYLTLRAIVYQRTSLVENSCTALIEVITSLHESGKEQDKHDFISACISALDTHGHEPRAPLYILEQLCHLISPPTEEPERSLILLKSPTQEEFIRGSMENNPYSSKECGPLMRDVKNKICRELQLTSFLDDDNGMELLVSNKIIKLDLPVVDVYDQVWAADESGSGQPMVVIFRLQGLDGEATEEMVDSLRADEEEDVDLEEKFGITLAITQCGGLDVLMDMAKELDCQKDHPLAAQLLTILFHCCRLQYNRQRLVALGAVPTLLEMVKFAFPREELADIAQQLLELLEALVQEASRNESDEMKLEESSDNRKDETDQMCMFLSKLDSPSVRQNPRIVQSVTHILPVLTYGQPAIAEILVGFFDDIDWNALQKSFDDAMADSSLSDSMKEDVAMIENDTYHLDCFVNVTESIRQDENGMMLRSVFQQRGVVDKLIDYLKNILPSGVPNSDPAWTKCGFGLRYVLAGLAGLVRGLLSAQQIILKPENKPLMASLIQLSTIATKEKLGNHAENLLDALREGNADVGILIDAINTEEKQRKEDIARKHREKVLQQMGMRQTTGFSIGKVLAAPNAFDCEIEDEEEFSCKVCREGYSYLPKKILGFYVFSTRSQLYPIDPRKGIRTVSNFNLIHHDCHTEAARADAKRRPPKGEWEGATLRNSSALCTNIFPILGPETDMEEYGNGMERYWRDAPVSPHSGGPRVQLLVHDLRLLLLRFVMGESFSDESRGGGKESNMRTVPFFVQMGVLMLDGIPGSSIPDSIRKRFEEQLSTFLADDTSADGTTISVRREKGDRSPSSLDSHRAEGPDYFLVLSLYLMSPEEWNASRFFFFKRLLAHSLIKARQKETESGDGDVAMTDDKDWIAARHSLFLFRVVDVLHEKLKPKPANGTTGEPCQRVSHPSNAPWLVQMKEKIRSAPFDLAESMASLASEWSDCLLPIASFDELLDESELLGTVLQSYSSVQDFVVAQRGPLPDVTE